MLGDSCLFRIKFPDGSVILAVTYVDYCTFAVSVDSGHEFFMSVLRSRFEIDESEGKPIEFLLGMANEQNSNARAVRTNMEMAIVKFAHGISTPDEFVKKLDVNFPMLSTSALLPMKESEVSASSVGYLSVVGSLIHFTTCMRPDISFAVSALSRHSLAPGKAHVKAARRLAMYHTSTTLDTLVLYIAGLMNQEREMCLYFMKGQSTLLIMA